MEFCVLYFLWRDIFWLLKGEKRFLDSVTRSWSKRIFEPKLGTHTRSGKSARNTVVQTYLCGLQMPVVHLHAAAKIQYSWSCRFNTSSTGNVFQPWQIFFFCLFFPSSVKMYFKRFIRYLLRKKLVMHFQNEKSQGMGT